MKKIILLIIILIIPASIFSQWIWQYPLPQGNLLLDINSPDNNTVYAVGNNGVIIKSSNGGQNWNLQISNTYRNLNSVFFSNLNTGWISGDTGKILKTTNGGINWINYTVGTNFKLHSIYFTDNQTGYLIADSLSSSIVYKTTNAGQYWTRSSNVFTSMNNLCFLNNNTGYIAGIYNVERTTNAGVNWSSGLSICGVTFGSIGFANNLTGYISCYGGYWKTTDGGNGWIMDSIPIGGGIKFFNSNYGYSFDGSYDKFYRTLNGGLNWNSYDIPGQYWLRAFDFASKDTIYSTSFCNILKSTNGGVNWYCLNDETANIIDISFINNNSGWAVGVVNNNRGVLLNTTNSGNSWTKRYPQNQKGIYSAKLFNENTGYVLQSDGTFAKTTDGGQNFTTASITGSNSLFCKMYFVEMNTGWCVGGTIQSIKLLYKTTNGGSSWFSQSNSYSLLDVKFLDNNTGWAAGINGKIIKTTNGGVNWLEQTSNTSSTLRSISFINYNTGWIKSSDGRVLKTTNGGLNWNSYALASYESGYGSVFFSDELTGYSVGYSMQKTTNGGINWALLSKPSDMAFNSLYFTNSSTGWIVGENCIIKTLTGGTSIIKIVDSNIPQKCCLSQNYPNPFNPVTKIKFDVPENGKLKIENGNTVLKVYDILGKVVATLVNERLQPGTYETTFDGSSLNSGIYFYKLLIGNKQSAVKKMVLLK
ncbi:MAG: YCF48-related protein [Ignavibacteria bacterium]|nr:YCF48-related protein [Ignavibacteria bacterium]